MFRAKVQIRYGINMGNLSLDKYNYLEEHVPILGLPPYNERKSWNPPISMIMTESQIELTVSSGIELIITRILPSKQDTDLSVCPSKIWSSTPDESLRFSIKPKVSPSLFEVDEAVTMVRLPTGELQKSLKDGWRILAVLPNPGEAYPDYILGRVRDERAAD